MGQLCLVLIPIIKYTVLNDTYIATQLTIAIYVYT